MPIERQTDLIVTGLLKDANINFFQMAAML